jgi:predicted dithiol-disulfide oxidoreductase (DUF899 family)
MKIFFPGESIAYREARDHLLRRELDLRRQMESVAAERRALPPGGIVPQDYAFHEWRSDGAPVEVLLRELFAPGTSALAVYHFMFPRWPTDIRAKPTVGRTALLPIEESPCPSCTALLDQLDAAAFHVAPHMNLVVVAKAAPERLAAFAQERGWRNLRLVSAASSTFARDYGAETAEGHPQPMLNVFQLDGTVIRHYWGSELLYEPTDPEQDPRHVGVLEPMWNLFDLTRQGRGADWEEQFSYSCCASPKGSDEVSYTGSLGRCVST